MTQTRKTIFTILLALGLSASLANTLANERIEEKGLPRPNVNHVMNYSSKVQSWGFAFDNDILVPGSRDQDYTYGLNVNFAGSQAREHWLSLHKALKTINRTIGFKTSALVQSAHKIEYGLFGFTPEDIQQAEINADDRPYASLVYVSSSSEFYDFSRDVSWNSSITIGLLGLNIVGKLQEEVHELTDSDQPQGWDHQISDGGELTARYTVARQSLLFQSRSGVELKSSVQASIGYITEASWSLGGRFGKIHTPWVSFNPEKVNYGEQSAQTTKTKVSERYLWAGIAVKARAYNAFLQGQFRSSDVSYKSNELRHGIIEAWLGYTFALSNGYRVSYSLRGHTSEIKSGNGDRNVLWGGINLSKTFSS